MMPSLKPLNRFDAVLFDLDGTLINHNEAARAGVVAWSHEYGVPADADRWMDIEQRWFAAFERGEVTHAGQRHARVREYLRDDALTDAQADEFFRGFSRHYLFKVQPYPDATTAITEALSLVSSGVTVGILTNGATDLQTLKLRRTRLWDDRLVVLAARELGAAKPNPECYRRALARIDVPTDRAVLIGDNLTNDVHGAINAGMHAVLVDRYGINISNGEYQVVTSLNHLRWR